MIELAQAGDHVGDAEFLLFGIAIGGMGQDAAKVLGRQSEFSHDLADEVAGVQDDSASGPSGDRGDDEHADGRLPRVGLIMVAAAGGGRAERREGLADSLGGAARVIGEGEPSQGAPSLGPE